MNQLKKILFALAVMVSLGLVGAVSAYAQGVSFTSTSLPRQLRGEGKTEAAGEVVLTVLGGGTIIAGSSIDIVYSSEIVNTPALTTNIFAGGVACVAGAGVCPDTVAVVGDFTLRLSYTVTDAASFTAGATLTIAEVRVDASAAGAGPITATMSGSSAAPGTNPISFTDPRRDVGVIVKPSLPARVPKKDDVAFPILTCAPPTSDTAAGSFNFRLTAEEAFGAAPATALQEAGFSDTPAPTLGTSVIVVLSGVPKDFIVAPVDITTGTTVGLTFGALPGAVTQTVAGVDITFVFTVTASDTATAEKLEIRFNIGTKSGVAVAQGGLTGDIKATVKIGLIGTGTILDFAENEQGSGTVATVSECVTRLLMPWAANIFGYDTGIVFANTSEDDAVFKPNAASATAQTGTCVLVGYPAAGGTTVSFTTPTVPAGQSQALVLSGTAGFSGFSGHILSVCNFLNAHAFVFLIDGFGAAAPRVAEGYVANVIPNASRVFAVGEALGH